MRRGGGVVAAIEALERLSARPVEARLLPPPREKPERKARKPRAVVDRTPSNAEAPAVRPADGTAKRGKWIELRPRLLALHKAGKTTDEIAETLGLMPATVRFYSYKLRREGAIAA